MDVPRQSNEPSLATMEMIHAALGCLTEGTSTYCILNLFRDSAEVESSVAQATLVDHRRRTGQVASDDTMRRNTREFLPRHGLQIIVYPSNGRWMIVKHNELVNTPPDLDQELNALVEYVRKALGLGESEQTTAAILFFLRQRIDAVKAELGED